jgi:hypothetical protein
MANVIHRTTLDFRISVNTPDFPEPTWKHNPDMSAVLSVPQRYWKAPPDWNVANAGPVEMTQAEKDAVDTAILNTTRDATTAQVDRVEDVLRASLLSILAEFNDHALRINEILDAVDAAVSLADLKVRVALILDYPQRTIAQIRTSIRNNLGS